MKYIAFCWKWVPGLVGGLALLLAGEAAFAVDSYSGGQLTIPSLAIGNASLTNVVVDVGTIVSGPTGSSGLGSEDRYDPTTGDLTVQSVTFSGHTYYNVVVTVKSLVSIGGLSGGDTYSNGVLSIPFVRVQNGALYGGGVVTQFKVDSAGGGMPQSIQDVYNPSNHQLTIMAIEVGGKVFTNAIITLESATVASYAAVVPNIVGDTESAALAALAPVYLGINNVTQQLSTTVPEGDIISQSPAAGTEVDEGIYLSIVVSAGAESLFYSFPAATATVEPYTLLSANGGLYGTTLGGGSANNGQIFSLSYSANESTLYQFPAAPGAGTYSPNSLIFGSDGNFYGTSNGGGIDIDKNEDAGTVFQMTPGGTLTTLWAFGDYGDGVAPNGVIQGSDGNLYGTTSSGATNTNGVLFKVSLQQGESVIYTFNGPPSDGSVPVGNLVEVGGLFYGATGGGGANGTGAIFAISASGSETILHSFAASGATDDGQDPVGGLLHAADGNLYGMTTAGGANDVGTIYEINLTGSHESVLYSFEAVPSTVIGGVLTSPVPVGSLVQASDGNFYGITLYGGTYNDGMVFKVTPSGTFTVVHSFAAGAADGALPNTLILASDGNLYGTTAYGGANNTGVVFKVSL
jgi:uncharacterized repeat protein (TIGR03803 family)